MLNMNAKISGYEKEINQSSSVCDLGPSQIIDSLWDILNVTDSNEGINRHWFKPNGQGVQSSEEAAVTYH